MYDELKDNKSLESLSVGGLSLSKLISIGATCIAEIDGQFFLLVEIEIGPVEQVIIFRISSTQAAILLRAGVRRCEIVSTIPTSMPGLQVNLICSFIVGQNVFLVFSIENSVDRLVLVRVPLCTVVG